MRRKKDHLGDVIAPARWISYDYRALYHLKDWEFWLLKHFPTLYFKRWRVDPGALAEITELRAAGYNVEVVFWEPVQERMMAALNLQKKIAKADPDLPTLYLTTVLGIRERGYEAFFTNRQEILAMFPSSFVRVTQLHTKLHADKIIVERARYNNRER